MIRKLKNFLRALMGNKKVAPKIANLRAAICVSCANLGRKRGHHVCSICGCRTQVLSRYVENLPEWGCKHPEREVGKGWPAEIVLGSVASNALLRTPNERTSAS